MRRFVRSFGDGSASGAGRRSSGPGASPAPRSPLAWWPLLGLRDPSPLIAALTAGLLGPLVAAAQLSAPHLALVSLAMGAGALGLSHVNDAGYWMFARLVGLDAGPALRTWTVLTTMMGLAGFGLTAAIWPLV